MHVCVWLSGIHYVYDQTHENTEPIQGFVLVLVSVISGAKMIVVSLCRGFVVVSVFTQ